MFNDFSPTWLVGYTSMKSSRLAWDVEDIKRTVPFMVDQNIFLDYLFYKNFFFTVALLYLWLLESSKNV